MVFLFSWYKIKYIHVDWLVLKRLW